MNDQSADILSKYEEKISELGFQLREYLLKHISNVIEQPDESANVIGFGFGPGYKDSICAIIPSKKGIKLGFYKGTELPDPAKLLTGSGKVHKFVAINSAKDISNPALKKLLNEALKAYQLRKRQ